LVSAARDIGINNPVKYNNLEQPSDHLSISWRDYGSSSYDLVGVFVPVWCFTNPIGFNMLQQAASTTAILYKSGLHNVTRSEFWGYERPDRGADGVASNAEIREMLRDFIHLYERDEKATHFTVLGVRA